MISLLLEIVSIIEFYKLAYKNSINGQIQIAHCGFVMTAKFIIYIPNQYHTRQLISK